MRATAFLLSLIVLLVTGNSIAFAGSSSPGKYYVSSYPTSHKSQIDLTGNKQESVIWSRLEREENDLVYEEVEDEEAVNDFSRKFKSLTDLYAIPSYQVVLDFLHHSANTISFLWRPVSYKYLQQRNLRI